MTEVQLKGRLLYSRREPVAAVHARRQENPSDATGPHRTTEHDAEGRLRRLRHQDMRSGSKV